MWLEKVVNPLQHKCGNDSQKLVREPDISPVHHNIPADLRRHSIIDLGLSQKQNFGCHSPACFHVQPCNTYDAGLVRVGVALSNNAT